MRRCRRDRDGPIAGSYIRATEHGDSKRRISIKSGEQGGRSAMTRTCASSSGPWPAVALWQDASNPPHGPFVELVMIPWAGTNVLTRAYMPSTSNIPIT